MNFCPGCGSPLNTRFVEGRDRWVCDACSVIHYRNPVPSTTCLIPTDAGIVLIKRGQSPGLGGWALPGGFVDAEETVSEAAVREVKEETNLDVELEGLLGVYSYVDPHKSGLVVVFQARVTGGTPFPGDDAQEIATFPPSEVPPLVFESHRRALALYEQLLARGSGLLPLL
ncbi:MAG TPA: NUDIX hydrolase [Chloroflexota bacterium]|nr:NUDIX hydrolase [Chloroflexota bacterium]